MYNDEVWYIKEGVAKLLQESSYDVVDRIFDVIRTDYPSAFKSLCDEYSKSSINVPYYKYLIVRRFCKCNFGAMDSTKKDVSSDLAFNFEKVQCPMRGECKLECIVCMPTYNSALSEEEKRVMKSIYDGLSVDEVASMLYKSPNTVKNQVKSVYKKLNINSRGAFVKFADEHNLFNL